MSLSPTRIFETLRAFQETAALKSAIELDVFTAVAEGAASPSEIASKCQASERGIRILCDGLVTSGLLLKHDGVYENAADANVFLNRHSPAYVGSIAKFLCDPEMTCGMLQNLTGQHLLANGRALKQMPRPYAHG